MICKFYKNYLFNQMLKQIIVFIKTSIYLNSFLIQNNYSNFKSLTIYRMNFKVFLILSNISSLLSSPLFGGTLVDEKKLLPAVCSLQRNHTHICGCILIREQWALTAAHCFPTTKFYIENYSVIFGKSDLRNTFGKNHEKINRIVIHGAFEYFSLSLNF